MARSGASSGRRTRTRRGWVLGHARAAGEGFGHIRANVLAAVVSMAVMAVAIGLPATLLALLENQRAVFAEWGAEPSLSVFLDKAVDEDQARALAGRIASEAAIKAVEVVNSAAAFAEFRHAIGLNGVKVGGHNPLPHLLLVTPHRETWDADGGQALVAALSARAEVDSVLVDFAWIDRLRAFSALASRALAVLAVLLIGAAVLIVGNTIRVLVAQQLKEIEVLKLVGATDAYVRRPFLYSGALHGLVAGILAVVLVEAVFLALSGPVAALAGAYGSSFVLSAPSLKFVFGVIALSALTGWSGAWLGTLLSLRQFVPTLDE